MDGTIIKGIAGFYYVKTENGIYECKARGKFRKENIIPLIGDDVLITPGEQVHITKSGYPEGTIEEIMTRRNQLIRPPVANVDQAIIVFSVSFPEIHLDLLDRFLVMVEQEHIMPFIVLNKIDEGTEDAYRFIIEGYEKAGYEVLCLSAKKKQNMEALKMVLKDKTSFFAGPSGVGKSTLLNAIEPKLELKTGEVSMKIKRGKHTTRHVELLPLESGGYVLDTPGFTSLQFMDMEKEELKQYFPEFHPYEGQCRFNGCSHIHEPGCAVKAALEKGNIFEERYKSYVTYYEELKNVRRW
ncbi:MAG: ribosome small subunit-dependent GTPase A [Cellulosilyticaceae bacterium]